MRLEKEGLSKGELVRELKILSYALLPSICFAIILGIRHWL